jgi:hypothetical protein
MPSSYAVFLKVTAPYILLMGSIHGVAFEGLANKRETANLPI